MLVPASELFKGVEVVKDPTDAETYVVFYKGRKTGYIIDKRDFKYYVTRRKFNEHYFRIYDGYGISATILSILKKNGVDKIVIIEENDEGERLLISKLEDWFEKGFSYTFEFPDGSKDPQRVLSVADMVVKV